MRRRGRRMCIQATMGAPGAPDRPCRSLAPAGCEESPQQIGAFLRQQAALDLGPVVQAGLVEDVEDASGGACLRIGRSVHQAG